MGDESRHVSLDQFAGVFVRVVRSEDREVRGLEGDVAVVEVDVEVWKSDRDSEGVCCGVMGYGENEGERGVGEEGVDEVVIA